MVMCILGIKIIIHYKSIPPKHSTNQAFYPPSSGTSVAVLS